MADCSSTTSVQPQHLQSIFSLHKGSSWPHDTQNTSRVRWNRKRRRIRPALYRERIVRAENASLNGLENLGFFEAAVVAGNALGLDVALLSRLSLAYVLSRVLYNVVFILTTPTDSFLCARESSLLGP